MGIPELRRIDISNFVLEHQRASINELARHLHVSEETIRRDLNALHAQGGVVKVHGGAIAPNTPRHATFERRSLLQSEEKRRIALAARKLFAAGESLMIDAGSTTHIFSEVMAPCGPFTVITNSLQVARNFWQVGKGHTVVMLGGNLLLDTEETLGEIALQQLKQFSVDHAILTISGITEAGQIMRYRIDEVMIARAMVERAKNVTIIADHSKIFRPALMTICDISQVTHLVTDREPPAQFAKLLADCGTNVVVAV